MSVLRRTTTTARDLLLLALPHGGQLTARRNAWASMSEGSARARRDAAQAMAVAIDLADLAVLRSDHGAALAH